MKNVMLALAVVAVLIFYPVTAESAPRAKTIFDYRKELNLTEEQEAKIRAALLECSTMSKAGKDKLEKLIGEYHKLVESDPTVEQARAKLQEIAAFDVEMRVKDFQYSKKINAVLTPEQLKKWREIKSSKTRTPPPETP